MFPNVRYEEQNNGNKLLLVTLTSYFLVVAYTPVAIVNETMAAIMVFRFQLGGLHHQPPEGDHTYFGYGYLFIPPYSYTMTQTYQPLSEIPLTILCWCALFEITVMASVMASTHAQRVTRLYRRSLKHLLSWCIDRSLWREEALKLRDRFDAAKNVSMPRAAQLLEEGEREFRINRHPEPYTCNML